ncbi:hypothetical protein EDD11_003983 [Mortierella claussenii]|nr:hypothetical protein EDD11_003983 [Mortierella claussenii]
MAPIQRIAQVSAHLLKTPASAGSIFTSGTRYPGAARVTSACSSLSSSLATLTRNYTSAADLTSSTSYKVTKKDRAFYPYSLDIQSRWADNDQYGHLNNAHYYALFDTVINVFLIQETGLDPHSDNQGNAIGVVAESGCQYFSSLSFPDMIEARLAVIKLGRSSVVYQVGIFKKLSRQDSHAIKTTPGSSPDSAGVFTRAATSVSDPVPDTDTRSVFHSSQLQADGAASGHFCHVFVDKTSRRPVPIPEKIRAGLELLRVTP